MSLMNCVGDTIVGPEPGIDGWAMRKVYAALKSCWPTFGEIPGSQI